MGLRLAGAGYTYDAGTPYAVEALRALDIEIEAGQLALVLGPTGSGKSTLLRLAAGLLAPTAGRVLVDGDPIRSPVEGGVAKVGLVFQAPETQLFAETVLDDVAFGPRNLGLDAQAAGDRAREALAAVGLDPARFGRRSPFALSGGEARRVALAGVLAMRPRYLLLDEPTAGLDAAGREALAEAIEGIRAVAGLMVVTHDAEEFLGRADSVLVLDGGTPVFSGTAAGLLEDPTPLEGAGLAIPEVLRVQLLARRAGLPLAGASFDPVAAASALHAALGKAAGR